MNRFLMTGIVFGLLLPTTGHTVMYKCPGEGDGDSMLYSEAPCPSGQGERMEYDESHITPMESFDPGETDDNPIPPQRRNPRKPTPSSPQKQQAATFGLRHCKSQCHGLWHQAIRHHSVMSCMANCAEEWTTSEMFAGQTIGIREVADQNLAGQLYGL